MRKLNLIFRAYNDGVAFRYELPEQKPLTDIAVISEDTVFHFAGDYKCYALELKSYSTGYESTYNEISLGNIKPGSIIGMPLLIKCDNCWAAVTEAALTDYAGMYLSGTNGAVGKLVSKLSPLPENKNIKVMAKTAFTTPWRTIMIGAQPGSLIESNLIENLNEKSVIGDVSWIKPGKVIWPWWNGRIVTDPAIKARITKAGDFGEYEPSTAVMKHYIDFAARHNIPYLLVDAGWYSLEMDAWRHPEEEDVLTMEETRKDFYDIREVINYGREKGVDVLLWVHGTSLKRQFDEALSAYSQWGVAGIKVDSSGGDGQEMVNFIHKLAKESAKHRLLLNFHGAYKPTGIERTYPNFMTREGVIGLEWAKWKQMPTPEHDVTIPFTRMLAGPMDYTPGAFDLDGTKEVPKSVQGTRTHQLAMYVVYFSPLQMLVDYPGAYENSPQDFEFIKNVPTVWDDTKVIAGMPGDYIAIARRRGNRWYLGVMTDENGRKIELSLDFLEPGRRYTAEIYKDAPDAGSSPEHIIFEKATVTSSQVLTVVMAGGGGQAVRLTPEK